MTSNGRLNVATLDLVDGWARLERRTARAYRAAQLDLLRRGQPQTGITSPDGAYRTIERQVYWAAYWRARGKPGNAADPGHSNHGFGTAVDFVNVSVFHRPTLVAVCAAYGLLFTVASEPWHAAHDGREIPDSALASSSAPIKITPSPLPAPARAGRLHRMSFYLTRNVAGAVFLETGIGRSHIAQPSHLALFQRVLATFPSPDTFNDAELDIMAAYKDAANARLLAPALAAIAAIPRFDVGSASIAIASNLRASGIAVDYDRVRAEIDSTLADNFAAVDAQAKANRGEFLQAVAKVGTIDTGSVTAAVERAVLASKIGLSPEVAGTIAGTVRAAIQPDLVRLELRNQVK